MALDMSVNNRRTRVTLTQGHKHFIMRVPSHSCRLQQHSGVHHRLILGLKRGLCWPSVLLTHCIWRGSGKAKPSRSSTRMPYSFLTSSHWKQPSLAMQDLALDFPVPHFLAAITRTSHSYSVELDNKEMV